VPSQAEMSGKAIVDFVPGQGKKSLHSRSYGIIFNEGMAQKTHWVIRMFWLDLTLEITVEIYPERRRRAGMAKKSQL